MRPHLCLLHHRSSLLRYSSPSQFHCHTERQHCSVARSSPYYRAMEAWLLSSTAASRWLSRFRVPTLTQALSPVGGIVHLTSRRKSNSPKSTPFSSIQMLRNQIPSFTK